jgi:cytochrome c oxidase subunit 1
MTSVGFLFHYIPMAIVGLRGMPRRYFDYLPQFERMNFLAGIGGFLMVAGMLLMFLNLFRSLRGPRNAPADPWGGTTLEWTIPSPPPVHNFPVPPAIPAYPYDFTKQGKNAP